MRNFWTVLFGIILISTICAGQVNFTPNWGKRSSLIQGADLECKSPLETVMYIYKILLSEAQKIIDCERLNNILSLQEGPPIRTIVEFTINKTNFFFFFFMLMDEKVESGLLNFKMSAKNLSIRDYFVYPFAYYNFEAPKPKEVLPEEFKFKSADRHVVGSGRGMRDVISQWYQRTRNVGIRFSLSSKHRRAEF